MSEDRIVNFQIVHPRVYKTLERLGYIERDNAEREKAFMNHENWYSFGDGDRIDHGDCGACSCSREEHQSGDCPHKCTE